MSGVRRARVCDAAILGHLEVETWRTTYAGMLADEVLLGMSVEKQTRAWVAELGSGSADVLVWEDDCEGVVAFGQCGPQRHHVLDYAGEIYTLYVLPDAQGMGIGRRLLLSLFADLVGAGLRSALVWVVRSNPSRFFYERLGAKLVAHRRFPMGGQAVEVLGYGWKDLAAVLRRPSRNDE